MLTPMERAYVTGIGVLSALLLIPFVSLSALVFLISQARNFLARLGIILTQDAAKVIQRGEDRLKQQQQEKKHPFWAA